LGLMRLKRSNTAHAPRAATVTAFSTYFTGLCMCSRFPQMEVAIPFDCDDPHSGWRANALRPRTLLRQQAPGRPVGAKLHECPQQGFPYPYPTGMEEVSTLGSNERIKREVQRGNGAASGKAKNET